MFCKYCGNQVPDGSQFCQVCGKVLSSEQGAAQTMQQSQTYQPYHPYQPYPSVAEPARGMAIASLVLGIISFFLFPIVCGPLGLIFGCVAKSKGNTTGKATAGIICSIIGFVLWLFTVLFLNSLINEIGLSLFADL